MVDTYGNMPGDLLNFGFLLLNPARLMLDKYVGFFENIDDKVFVENFIRMEKWIFDSPDVPGETFRQFIKDCYQKNLLIQSKMEIGGQTGGSEEPHHAAAQHLRSIRPSGSAEACELLTSRVGSTGHRRPVPGNRPYRDLRELQMPEGTCSQIAGWLLARDGNEGEAAAPHTVKDEPKPEAEPKSRTASTKKKSRKLREDGS